jgi:pyridinium-3,5-biscarboxylic acid mononucleotide synthase
MNFQENLKRMLERVRDGEMSVADAEHSLRTLPYEDLDFAKIDHHRVLRRGYPEVIYGAGKTVVQLRRIAKAMAANRHNLLVTRVTPEQAKALIKELPKAKYHKEANAVSLVCEELPKNERPIVIVTAGTSDIPVAEEAVLTASLMGNHVERLFDAGVAGIHRILQHAAGLERAGVVVVVAGMEGALASVVAGLVDCPVVAVPTSVGYGASFKGLSALLGMLNTCAPGVAVVNIDNGFGGGYLAAVINRDRPEANNKKTKRSGK